MDTVSVEAKTYMRFKLCYFCNEPLKPLGRYSFIFRFWKDDYFLHECTGCKKQYKLDMQYPYSGNFPIYKKFRLWGDIDDILSEENFIPKDFDPTPVNGDLTGSTPCETRENIVSNVPDPASISHLFNIVNFDGTLLLVRSNEYIRTHINKKSNYPWTLTKNILPDINIPVFLMVSWPESKMRTLTVGTRMINDKGENIYITENGKYTNQITHWQTIPSMRKLVIDYQVFPDFPEVSYE